MPRKRSHAIGSKPKKKSKRQRVAEIKATIAHLKTLQGLRAKGVPVSYTTDPVWLLDAAIDRRGGYVEDPHARDMAQPTRGRHAGKLPRKATGDAQGQLSRITRDVNSRVRMYPAGISGPWRKELEERMPERFVQPGDDY